MASRLSNMPSMATMILLLLYHQMGPAVVLSNKDVILPSFSWDPRNECFNNTKNRFADGYAHFQIDQDSQMYFICPSEAITYVVQTSFTPRKFMFENMYICTKKEFMNCEIRNITERTQLVMKCDDPLDTEKLKYKHFSFARMRSSPEEFEFHAGKTYYFIATSDGTESGLDVRKHGRCKTNNMRLAITICGRGEYCHKSNPICNKDGIKSKGPQFAHFQPTEPPARNVIQTTIPTTTTTVVPSVSETLPETLRAVKPDGGSVAKRDILYITLAAIGGIFVGILLTAGIWKIQRASRRVNKNRLSGAPSTATEHVPVDDADEQKEDLDTISGSIKIEIMNQKYFTSVDYRNSNEFHRLISTASTCSSNRYSDGERHCVTPIGGYK